MAKELGVIQRSFTVKQEQGFVLVTALIMLSLLTLMSIAMYFSGRSATQTSASAQASTEAYYYAETAINYISWAIHNDAEFDSYAYASGAYRHSAFVEPTPPSNNVSVGDLTELNAYLSDPGPTAISDTGAGVTGQIEFFDNTPLSARSICFYSEADPGTGVALTYPNCIDVQLPPNDTRLLNAKPVMHNISLKLPRYIKFEIAADGTVAPSIPQLPHRGPASTPTPGPVVEEDIPRNGAIVWITAAGNNSSGTYPDSDTDIEIFPIQPSTGQSAVQACTALGASCPCSAATSTVDSRACDANAGIWLDGAVVAGAWNPPYKIVAYAIGYVNGKPTHIIRSVIY